MLKNWFMTHTLQHSQGHVIAIQAHDNQLTFTTFAAFQSHKTWSATFPWLQTSKAKGDAGREGDKSKSHNVFHKCWGKKSCKIGCDDVMLHLTTAPFNNEFAIVVNQELYIMPEWFTILGQRMAASYMPKYIQSRKLEQIVFRSRSPSM